MKPRHGRGSNQYRQRLGRPSDRASSEALREALETERVAWSFHPDTPTRSQDVRDPRNAAECVRWAAHPHAWYRMKAARSDQCPSEVLAVLAVDDNREVKSVALGNRRCPTDALQQAVVSALHDDDQSVLATAMTNRSMPSEGYDLAFRDLDRLSLTVRLVISKNPGCPPDRLRQLWETGTEFGVLQNVASNRNCPPDVLVDVIRRRGAFMPQAVRNPNCPVDVLVGCLQDPKMVEFVAENPALPDEHWKAAALRAPRSRAARQEAARSTDPEFLQEMAYEGDTRTKSVVAANPATDRRTLVHLFRVGSVLVDRGLAANPATDHHRLRALRRRKDPQTMQIVDQRTAAAGTGME